VLATCRELGVPVTARGAGTSIAGNAVGPRGGHGPGQAPVAGAVAGPGGGHRHGQAGRPVHDLQAAPHGLTFGPDPSSLGRCTLGGMIAAGRAGHRRPGAGPGGGGPGRPGPDPDQLRALRPPEPARLLADKGFEAQAVSRAYFAAFFAAETALLALGETPMSRGDPAPGKGVGATGAPVGWRPGDAARPGLFGGGQNRAVTRSWPPQPPAGRCGAGRGAAGRGSSAPAPRGGGRGRGAWRSA
jgi:hypothetical protein